MDQFAFHDIPDSIDYILETTSQLSLSYVGFSQGTAQAFATLSIHPTLNDKIDVFIALAPAMSPAGLRNGIVDSLVKASPEVLFLAFGRRSILSSATMWQSILYPPIFVRILDMSLLFLFNWTGRNISPHQKLAAYPHLYSFTSTKSVVHWFQIIRNRSFQMYDDDVQTPLGLGASDRYYKVAKFPTRNIKTPIVLVYGGSDSLVDINVMLKELPRHTIAREIPHYEHLDFLWGQQVDNLVFPYVFEALAAYSGRDHMKAIEHTYKATQSGQFVGVGVKSRLEEDSSPLINANVNDIGAEAAGLGAGQATQFVSPPRKLSANRSSPGTTRHRRYCSPHSSSSSSTEQTSASMDGANDARSISRPKPYSSLLGNGVKHTRRRTNSIASTKSFESLKRVASAGISIGAGKATIGISNPSQPSRITDKIPDR